MIFDIADPDFDSEAVFKGFMGYKVECISNDLFGWGIVADWLDRETKYTFFDRYELVNVLLKVWVYEGWLEVSGVGWRLTKLGKEVVDV